MWRPRALRHVIVMRGWHWLTHWMALAQLPKKKFFSDMRKKFAQRRPLLPAISMFADWRSAMIRPRWSCAWPLVNQSNQCCKFLRITWNNTVEKFYMDKHRRGALNVMLSNFLINFLICWNECLLFGPDALSACLLPCARAFLIFHFWLSGERQCRCWASALLAKLRECSEHCSISNRLGHTRMALSQLAWTHARAVEEEEEEGSKTVKSRLCDLQTAKHMDSEIFHREVPNSTRG